MDPEILELVITEVLEEQKKAALMHEEMLSELKIINEKIERIQLQKIPAQTIIKHQHHVRSSVLFTAAFAITIVVLTWFCLNTQSKGTQNSVIVKKDSSPIKAPVNPGKKLKKRQPRRHAGKSIQTSLQTIGSYS